MVRQPQPDFLLVGAPKAGTTALHAALASHPQVFVSDPKEPKYWLCDDAPPPAWRGPGDAHSQQEWMWRRADYARLFEPAPADAVRGESTPFYLWSRGAHRRIGEQLPDVRIIAVVRDPVDRAYSNWMHLWSDGLEPEADFMTAFALQDERVAAGWAPFWRYRDLGRYGEQLAHLRQYVDPARILVVRYREIVDDPAGTLDRTAAFLGIEEGHVGAVPRDNQKPYVERGWRPTVFGPAVRAGAWAGQFAPPQVWRRASVPMIARLRRSDDAVRPRLTEEQRSRLVPVFADDVALLSSLTGRDFSDWLSYEAKGSFAERSAARVGSAHAGEQVVRAVGAGGLEVEPGATVR